MQTIYSYLGALSLGLILASCSSSPVIQSVPQTKPIVVDGDASDWQLPLAFYDKETKLSFTVSNDSAKLYFCFEAFDQELQTKIVRGGLQIAIDTTGGKSTDITMQYPVPSTFQRTEPQTALGYGSSSEDFDPIGTLRRNFLRLQTTMIQLTGFCPPAAGLVSQKNPFGIEVRINWDTLNNVLNYEAAIPFSMFYHRALTLADSNKILGLTFTVNGVNRPNASNRQATADVPLAGDGGTYPGGAGAGYPGAGGGGGFGGGGMGRGGGGHRSGGKGGSESNPLSESQTLSLKLHLAKAG